MWDIFLPWHTRDMFIFGDHRFKCVVPKNKNVLNRVLLTNSTLKKQATWTRGWKSIKNPQAIPVGTPYPTTKHVTSPNDSVIYTTKPGQSDIPLGDFLGDMTKELDDGDFITEFKSAGPKNYGYKIHWGKVCCNVWGFCIVTKAFSH